MLSLRLDERLKQQAGVPVLLPVCVYARVRVCGWEGVGVYVHKTCTCTQKGDNASLDASYTHKHTHTHTHTHVPAYVCVPVCVSVCVCVFLCLCPCVI
jgi:hypothetical protein